MPSKQRLVKTKIKSNHPSNLQQDANQPSTSNTSLITPELELQFETELCWCIQQLQTALKTGKLSSKQAQDHTKALNTLMSNSSSMIKKRQVMRLSFGDYRVKMALEDKKKSRNAMNMKVKPAAPSRKSAFIKKSTVASSTGNTFRFNFDSPKDSNTNDGIPSNEAESESFINNKMCNIKVNDSQFVHSDNSFRFSFNVNEEL